MKLKKLMALALSGVLAVSMFAGCAKADVKPEDPTDPEGPVAVEGDISAGVAANIENLPSYIEFAADSDLSKSLDYVVGFANIWDIEHGFGEPNIDHIHGIFSDLQDRLENAVGVTKWDPNVSDNIDKTFNVKIDNIGDESVLVEAEKASTVEIDDAKAAQLYVVSGVIEEPALNALVAEEIEDTIKAYEHVVENHGHNGLYDHSYTVSVSVDSKDVNGVEATFVAVQVVRSSARS